MMHQEIECPEEEWCSEYVLGQIKKQRDAYMERITQQLEASFWKPGPQYQAARDADAFGLVTDECEWKRMGEIWEWLVEEAR